ncbi:hypothetical protein JW872_00475 [Candidatus Babeliales bacterium]|nr:hypothetical protein [Candidatus Babeliales bacterium]
MFLASIFGRFESQAEFRKYSFLGVIFGCLIATYWAMLALKDGIFGSIVGAEYTGFAKIFSLFVLLCVLTIYGKIVENMTLHRAFYMLTVIYALSSLCFAYFLNDPIYGIPNTVESPTRIIGWLWYVFVESAGTMFVPLFWAIAAEVSTPESGKRGFPLIFLCAQFGNIIGPWFLRARRLGFQNSAPIVVIIAILIACIGVLMWFFMKTTPASEFHPAKTTQGRPGFFEGLQLLIQHRYLLRILLIAGLYETITTLVDLYFKVQVKNAFPIEALRSEYLAQFAVAVGILSTCSLLFGVSSIQRKLGIKASLMLMPILSGIGIIVWWSKPIMAVSFGVVLCFKAFNYSLNQPSVKQLYIPTTKDARRKTQAWIEVFAGRGSKAMASTITALKFPLIQLFGPLAGLSLFLTCASSVGLLLAAAWFYIARDIAQQYEHAVSQNTTVC